MFHLLGYQVTTGAAAADTDLDALVDTEFSQRNDHYIFTGQWQLLAAAGFGATLTRQNIRAPSINAVSLHNVWPVNASLLPPANPQISWLVEYPLQIPVNEEIEVRTSNTGAGEVNACALWVAPPGWNANVPRGLQFICMRATTSNTLTAESWSAFSALTFEQSPRGGVYAVCGAQVQSADCRAFRLNFPRQRMVNGRKLLPGGLATTTIGQAPNPRIAVNPCWAGEWGRFHTFEPPTIQGWGSAAGAETQEIRLFCVYLGESESLLNN